MSGILGLLSARMVWPNSFQLIMSQAWKERALRIELVLCQIFQLAVVRAFGDKSLKMHPSSEPDVALDITDDDREFILASDGLLKVMTNQEAVDLIKHIKDARSASKHLTEEYDSLVEVFIAFLGVFNAYENMDFAYIRAEYTDREPQAGWQSR
ncbi:hypothetical protein FNV43_RR15936 [Rhamnella rubrinervis]|uniref:PPM-type phosphatase domain-containing protein n=1 Tax=Rhamnella rubrinervis TaxID=2594499 RepID=A0A8K0E9Z6_9ROSA|nr:hypothetical protein FNV43_RR15936 [Rhamnella rubrinervis]